MAAKWFSFVVGLGLLSFSVAALSGATFQGTTVAAVALIFGLLGMKIGLTDTPS